jgi:uncharacterized membrane protein
VARQIIAQTTERKIEEQQEKKTTKGFGSIVWLAILGIFASPIAIPLAFAAVVIFISFIITIGSIVFAFGVSGVACVIAGLLLTIAGFLTPSFGQKFVAIGAGLFVIGLGIMFLLLTSVLAKLMVKMISGIIRKMASRHSKRKMSREEM